MKSTAGLLPANDETTAWLLKKKLGSTIVAEIHEIRNAAFHRKWFALVKVGFDYWRDNVDTLEYKGKSVMPNFDRFRKDVTILAGFYEAVTNIKGEVRLEAESLKWSKMTEERFTQLYDATIRVLLEQVFNGRRCAKWSEHQLRSVVEQIEAFAA